MTATVHHFALYLASEGDSVTLINLARDGVTIPEQASAAACTTRREVLVFLEALNSSQTRDQLTFYHQHTTSYPGHPEGSAQGKFHSCPLANQIDFVHRKIGENPHDAKHASRTFCVIV
jgi:hypothetical protein